MGACWVYLAAAGIVGILAAMTGIAVAGVTAESDHEGSAGGLVYRSSTLQFAGSGSAAAACPQGKHVSGGGAVLDGSTTDASIGGLAPDYVSPDISFKEGYAARAYLTGLGQNLKTIAICAPADDVTYRKKKEPFTTAGTPVELKARCPAGTRVTGGGIANGGSDDDLLISAPFDGSDVDSKPDDGWRGRIIPTGTADSVTLRAACSDELQLSYKRDQITGMGTLSKGVSCPADSAVSGGGAELTGDLGGYFHSSTPADIGDANTTPEDGWSAVAQTPGTRTMTVHAICKS